jgi:hypothetical protein
MLPDSRNSHRNSQSTAATDQAALIATGFDLGWQLAAAYRIGASETQHPGHETETQPEPPQALSKTKATGLSSSSPLIAGLARRLAVLLNDEAPSATARLTDTDVAAFTRKNLLRTHDGLLEWLASHDRHATTAYKLGVQLSDLAATPSDQLPSQATKDQIREACRALNELSGELGPRVTDALVASLNEWSEQMTMRPSHATSRSR